MPRLRRPEPPEQGRQQLQLRELRMGGTGRSLRSDIRQQRGPSPTATNPTVDITRVDPQSKCARKKERRSAS